MNKENLSKIRHTTSHLLAAAILEIYPKTKLTIGPATEDGFYYDFEFEEPISEKDLPKIEKRMKKILPTWKEVKKREVTAGEAKKIFKNNPYKIELIEEIEKKGEKITLYKSGEFEDLCRGGHTKSPKSEISAFKLLAIAGAYWRGDEKNKMLTRIYGTAFPTQKELDDYLIMLEEAKKRDHRKLGQELDLFTFSDLVGAGLPMYTPKGTILRDELASFSEKLQADGGFEKVWIPHITKIDLYKKSGHWDKFGDELMLVTSQETDDKMALKPMNCPHHTQIYASRPRSYKDLPIRYMETTTNYRDEKTGELGGLTRVRSLTQDDGHVFCTEDQIEKEFENIMTMIQKIYTTLGMKFIARLSFRDKKTPEKYLGDDKIWEKAEKTLENVAAKLGLNYYTAEGEAAIYGPKIDIMVTDALGRQWQCATEQLDFIQPQRFGLEYTAEDGTKKTPVMIHKALLGTIDRFLGVYIEHTAGNFPLWLAPTQVCVLPVSEKVNDYAEKVTSELKDAGIRVELDSSSQTLGSKIRKSTLQKVPLLCIIGEQEVEKGVSSGKKYITIRTSKGQNLGTEDLENFIVKIKEQIEKKSQEQS